MIPQSVLSGLPMIAPIRVGSAVSGRLLAVVSAVSLAVACVAAPPKPPANPETPTPPPADDGTPRVVIETGTRLQTMTGWEATIEAGVPSWLSYRDEVLDRAVDELGIDRLRVEVRSGAENSRDTWTDWRAGNITREEWRSLRYATVNDNNDPFVLNEAGFRFSELDQAIEEVVLPFRQRLEARGRRLHVNLCYVAFTGQITTGAYHHQNAEEYAEFVQAAYLHLQNRYGFVPDSWEMLLEPDNVVQWTAPVMRQAMIATGNRLAAMGFTPKLVAPSTTHMGNALAYAEEIGRNGPPRFWTELSYHRYAGVSASTLASIASRATQWNLQTAMLEHIGSAQEDLNEDLTTGRNSAWAQSGLAGPDLPDDGGRYYTVSLENPLLPRVTPGSRTRFLRQDLRYVVRGAVRVGASSSAGRFKPAAFINPDNRVVLVVNADEGGAVAIQGLPAGTYEATYATADQFGAVLATFTAGSGDVLRLTMPGRGVFAVRGAVESWRESR